MSRSLTLALILFAGVTDAREMPQDTRESSRVIDDLVAAHNRIRTEKKLSPLKPDPDLMKAAQVHARDMADHEKMTHEGSDGSTPAQRVEHQGYHYLSTGENVAAGQESVEEVMDGWMNSEHHRRNILGDYSEMGAARAQDSDGRFYWVVDFGRPIPRLDPKEAAQGVVEQINKKRSESDRPALQAVPKLTDAAQAAAEDLAENDTVRHRSGGSVAFDVVRREGYPYREIQQSSASGYPTPEKMVESLMNQDNAEQSLLGNHKHVGAGYARAKDGTPYWVVLFATPQ
ncbi:MAG TPA: CAP domain-containing protein [Isosphaeraceae bacterium]|nr:CAP domain-containing protein [Isosphaeraceae bacterium]